MISERIAVPDQVLHPVQYPCMWSVWIPGSPGSAEIPPVLHLNRATPYPWIPVYSSKDILLQNPDHFGQHIAAMHDMAQQPIEMVGMGGRPNEGFPLLGCRRHC